MQTLGYGDWGETVFKVSRYSSEVHLTCITYSGHLLVIIPKLKQSFYLRYKNSHKMIDMTIEEKVKASSVPYLYFGRR